MRQGNKSGVGKEESIWGNLVFRSVLVLAGRVGKNFPLQSAEE